jgi:hypothetical protein
MDMLSEEFLNVLIVLETRILNLYIIDLYMIKIKEIIFVLATNKVKILYPVKVIFREMICLEQVLGIIIFNKDKE